MSEVRIDKFIWAVRLYKTRSISAKAVKDDQVFVNETKVKPSQNVKIGDVIKVKRLPIWRSYKVKELLSKRVGAKLVNDYIDDVTPEEELEKLEMMKLMPGYDRERGKGRPTKKERRNLDDFNRW